MDLSKKALEHDEFLKYFLSSGSWVGGAVGGFVYRMLNDNDCVIFVPSSTMLYGRSSYSYSRGMTIFMLIFFCVTHRSSVHVMGEEEVMLLNQARMYACAFPCDYNR